MAWPSYAHVLDVDVDIGGTVNHGCAPCSNAQTEIAEQASKPHGLAIADQPACIEKARGAILEDARMVMALAGHPDG